MTTWPLVGRSRPATIRSTVDFPHPDGPSRTRKSRSGDVDRHVVDRRHGAEALGHVIEDDTAHDGEG